MSLFAYHPIMFPLRDSGTLNEHSCHVKRPGACHAARAALRRARERVPQGIALTHARHAERRRAPSATRVKRLATVLVCALATTLEVTEGETIVAGGESQGTFTFV